MEEKGMRIMKHVIMYKSEIRGKGHKISVWNTIHDFHVLRFIFKIIFEMKYFNINYFFLLTALALTDVYKRQVLMFFTEVPNVFQMVIVYRYIINSKQVERFWGFIVPPKHDAQSLASCLLDERSRHNLLGISHKLTAQTIGKQ